nr:acyltransferase domain-containing protein [uncultured Lichenicoccus sp.]
MTSDTVAILCSGQGAQHRDMFALTGGLAEAQPVFAAAAVHLDGVDPRHFARDADDAALFSNQAGQVLCCTQALAAWAALGGLPGARVIVAGYSVGELAAWHCSGMLDATATLALVAARAHLMDTAAAGLQAGLAAIVGLHRNRLDAMLRDTGCELAIVNGPDSVVAGGLSAGLDRLCERARAAGAARVVRLRVAVPAHTSWLSGAVEGFQQALLDASPRPPRHALLSGIDGERVRDVPAGCERLARQIAHTIDWSACVAQCAEAGSVRMLELGPGRVLARHATAAVPDADARAMEDFRSLQGVGDWLQQTAG